MATEGTVFATLACCLLAISVAMAQTNMAATPGSNTTTFVTSADTTANATVAWNVTENTTPFTGTWTNDTATTEVTGHTQTSESTTGTTQTTAPGSGSSSSSSSTLSTPAVQNTTGHTRSPNTTLLTTTNTTEQDTTQAVGLKVSEESMTIVFSVMLGLFGFGFIVFMFNKCRHKFQYLPQPLNNSSDTDVLVADDDTLVISGGLYDGHPNHDNAPTAPADESQFRLEFLH